MKIRSENTIWLQQQFRSPEPICKIKGFFNPLSDMLLQIKKNNEDKLTKSHDYKFGKVDIKV